MAIVSSPSPGALVALGVVVGLVSTCVQSVGLTLQRKSHMLEDEKEDRVARRPAYRRRRWQIGMFLFLIANIIGSSIQITTLPLPLLSTLQASGLVFNSLLATLLLKESWTRRTACGTVLVATGALIISFFAALPEPSHNLKQLLVLFRMPSFLVWFVLSLVFVGAVLVTDFALRKCISQDNAKVRLIRGMSYGMISGILSAHALLLAKSAVELIVTSVVDHVNQFRGYQSWIMLLAFVLMALAQLYYLHLGLKLISTSVLYPFVFCIYNIVAILDGLIYFRQMDRLPPLHAGLIALGTVILLAGVLALSWRLQYEEDSERPEMSQPEIPQTLLVPGSGFVADPDDDTNESAILTEDEDLEIDERHPLVTKSRTSRTATIGSRPSSHPRSLRGARKRKRATTLKEVSEIWHDLHDEEDTDDFGTFEHGHTNGRPCSAGHQRQRRHRRLSAGRDLEAVPDDGTLEPGSLTRAETMPAPQRSESNKRRRKSGHEGGALFSELLKRDWWRSRRKDEYDDSDGDDEGPPTTNGGPSSRQRISSAPDRTVR